MDSNDREVREELERTQSALARARRELDTLRRRADQERLESTARLAEERTEANELAQAERRRAADALQALTESEARVAQLEAALSRSPDGIIGPARHAERESETELHVHQRSETDSPARGVIIGPARHEGRESETEPRVHRRNAETDSPAPGVIIGPAKAPRQDSETDLGPIGRIGVGLMGLILLGASLHSGEVNLCFIGIAAGLIALALFMK